MCGDWETSVSMVIFGYGVSIKSIQEENESSILVVSSIDWRGLWLNVTILSLEP